MSLPLALLLALSLGAVRAQEAAVMADSLDARPAPGAGAECAALPRTGCLYVPAAARAEAGLLVYFRGHWGDYRGRVPEGKRVESARAAFSAYGLKAAAERAGMAVLVTGSSSVGVGASEVEEAQALARRVFLRLVFVAHSGGYVGLQASLPGARPVSRIVMLDDFYFEADLTALIREAVARGASCAGFVTRHNESRWRERFSPFVACPVDRYQDSEHEAAVPRCLCAYLERSTCL